VSTTEYEAIYAVS